MLLIARVSFQRRDHDPPRQGDLEIVAAEPAGVGQFGRCGLGMRRAGRQRRLRLGRTPGLQRHRAQRHLLARQRQAEQAAGVGGAVAHLAVFLPALRRRGQHDGGDQLARLEVGLDVRRLARQAVHVVDRQRARRAGRRHGLDPGLQRRERDSHVGGVGGDAGLAGAQDRTTAADALQRAAAGAWLAFVAGLGGVVEVRATGALHQVAADGGLVAQLRRGAGDQGVGQHRIERAHAPVRGRRAVADHCADAQTAVGRRLDLRQRQAPDIDQMRRPLDLQLHQVEQIGAAREELGARRLGRRLRRTGRAVGALIGERPHAAAPTTSRIASSI
jgi:hypothetical protein